MKSFTKPRIGTKLHWFEQRPLRNALSLALIAAAAQVLALLQRAGQSGRPVAGRRGRRVHR